jgi:glycosyltransferase involved in cell wall biosynthesis
MVCRREKFDIVHTHTLLPGIAGRVAAKLAGVPAVIHTFHSWPLHKPRSKLFSFAYRSLELVAAYFADSILFQNGDDMTDWSQIPNMPTEKAELIGNGIDTQAIISRVFPEARSTVRREFGIEDDVTVIIMVSRLELYKGHIMLLNSLQEIISSTDHKVSALFVGIGKDRPLIEEEVKRLGLENIVIFTGYRLDVPNLLVASDISVLPSQYEGIPRALMESMVLGIPVIATNVPGCRTLICSDVSGILITLDDISEMANAIVRLIEDPDLAGSLANSGKQTVLREFDEHNVAARIEDIYRLILEKEPPRLPDMNIEANI